MNTIVNLVRQFYTDVDREDWVSAMSLYDKNIHYKRVEPKVTYTIYGINELKRFYVSVRDIRGNHNIERITETDNRVVVEGMFVGMKYSDSIKLSYIDEFDFDDRKKVIKRNSIIKIMQ